MPDIKTETNDPTPPPVFPAKEPTAFVPTVPDTPTVPAAEPPPATPVLPQDVPASRKPVCPVCKNALEVYVGDNVHKLSTAFCRVCGVRHHLRG